MCPGVDAGLDERFVGVHERAGAVQDDVDVLERGSDGVGVEIERASWTAEGLGLTRDFSFAPAGEDRRASPVDRFGRDEVPRVPVRPVDEQIAHTPPFGRERRQPDE